MDLVRIPPFLGFGSGVPLRFLLTPLHQQLV